MRAEEIKLGMRIVANNETPGTVTRLPVRSVVHYTDYEGKPRTGFVNKMEPEEGAPIVNFDEKYENAYQFLANEKADELKAYFEDYDEKKINELQSISPSEYENKYNPI